MGRQIELKVHCRFVGYHRWKDAPQEVVFLRFWHRHVFHVDTFIEVGGDNREVEFFIAQREVQKFLDETFKEKHFEYSCEQIAGMVIDHLESTRKGWKTVGCEVSEDGENSAFVNVTEESLKFLEMELPGIDDPYPETKRDLIGEVRTDPFFGIECEGPERGNPTLFIPGIVSVTQFHEALAKAPPLDHVYLGAGNNRQVNLELFHAAVEWGGEQSSGGRSRMVTVEFDSANPLINDGAVLSVYVARSGEEVNAVANILCDWYKVIDEKEQTITWMRSPKIGAPRSIVTRFDDPWFAADFYV